MLICLHFQGTVLFYQTLNFQLIVVSHFFLMYILPHYLLTYKVSAGKLIIFFKKIIFRQGTMRPMVTWASLLVHVHTKLAILLPQLSVYTTIASPPPALNFQPQSFIVNFTQRKWFFFLLPQVNHYMGKAIHKKYKDSLKSEHHHYDIFPVLKPYVPTISLILSWVNH